MGGLWLFHDAYESTLNLAEIIQFSVIICAVDPVAVLTVFEDIKVNEVREKIQSLTDLILVFSAPVHLRVR